MRRGGGSGAPGAAVAAGVLACGLAACGGSESTLSACGTPDPADSYTLGDEAMGCVGSADATHADVYSFIGPATASGADTQIQIDNAAGTVRATVYGADNTAMATFTAASPGAALVFHLAAGPGASYRLAVDDGGGFASPYSYRLTSTFTAIPDNFEPNDSPEKAMPIPMATPVDAFLFAGASTSMPADAIATFDDYYQVMITETQTATVRIDNVPTDLAARLFLYRSDLTELARIATGHRGEALVMATPLPLDPGTYLVRVAPWAEVPTGVSAGAQAPDHFTRGYQLTVTQP